MPCFAPTLAVPVSITVQPVDRTVLVRDSPTFTCSVFGTAPVTVTWFRRNTGEGEGTRVDDNVESVPEVEEGSAEVTVTSTLTLPGVSESDDGSLFYCVVSNNLTEAGLITNQSDSASLTVQCTLINIFHIACCHSETLFVTKCLFL